MDKFDDELDFEGKTQRRKFKIKKEYTDSFSTKQSYKRKHKNLTKEYNNGNFEDEELFYKD